uniref:MARVEL domain-containing protein n=1 Tax=Ditylenchus dipsaci TaxID=166011 RepID=A0A915DFH7_9BILA
MEKWICVQYPHLFKPVQSVNAVILLICLGTASSVDGSGVLWFVTFLSLIISTLATVVFMLDKNEPIVFTVSGGTLSWNIVEFVYSSILSILCAISFWLAFGYASHVPKDGHSAGYVFTGMFMIVQTILYAIPTMLVYDRMRVAEEDAHITHPFNTNSEQDISYQTERVV